MPLFITFGKIYVETGIHGALKDPLLLVTTPANGLISGFGPNHAWDCEVLYKPSKNRLDLGAI